MDTQIERIVNDSISKIAYPTECTITKIYRDYKVDINSNYGRITYVDTIGMPSQNSKAILIFLDNNFSKPIVLIDNKNIE